MPVAMAARHWAKRNRSVKVFFDTEFTGLHQNTTLISIGLMSEDGEKFYAELTDFDRRQIDQWIQDNVVDRLLLSEILTPLEQGNCFTVKGPRARVEQHLREWLNRQSTKNAVYGDMRNVFPDRHPQKLEMWSDCYAYDWVLFCDLFGGALNIPDCVYYIPFDLSTLFKIKGIDPDVNREEYAGLSGGEKHNALWDAKIIKACYERAMQL